MKPETEAKAIIGLIISLIAFGFGSGAGIVMGLSQNDTPNTTQVTTNQDVPQVPSTKNVNINTEPQNTTSNSADTNSDTVYEDNSGSSGSDSGNGSENDNSDGNSNDNSGTSV
jgi:hypothetical protein